MPVKNYREYNNERYHWFKDHHFCTNCGKQDAYTLGGRALCFECTEIKRKYRPTKERQNQISRERAKKCKENHICVQCKRRKARENRVRCEKCSALEAMRYQMRKKPSYRDSDGLCVFCGNHLDGQLNRTGERSKLCKACYGNLIKRLKK